MSITYDEIPRLIAICNDGYKFVVYPHSILQEFAVENEMMVIVYFGRFPPGTVSKLHARRTVSYRVMRRIVVITHELNIPLGS